MPCPYCGKPVKARGLCDSHYKRLMKHGSPTGGRRTPMRGVSAEERFWAMIDKHGPTPKHQPELGPCWQWSGGLSAKGYGKMQIGRGSISIHRFAHELLVGPIPEGMHIDHLCRNRACGNPGHLEVVTPAENHARGERAPQTHCKRGHPLTPDNLYFRKNGKGRACKTCALMRAHKHRAVERH